MSGSLLDLHTNQRTLVKQINMRSFLRGIEENLQAYVNK